MTEMIEKPYEEMTEQELRAEFAEAKRRHPGSPVGDQWTEDTPMAISLRVTNGFLQRVRDIAQQQGVGYQTLLKRWAEERLVQEELAARVADIEPLMRALRSTFVTLRKETGLSPQAVAALEQIRALLPPASATRTMRSTRSRSKELPKVAAE